MLIVYGDQRETTLQLRRDAKLFPNITLFPVRYLHLHSLLISFLYRQDWKSCLELITGLKLLHTTVK